MLLLQVLIALSGNYNFFNFLTVLLSLLCIDDAAFGVTTSSSSAGDDDDEGSEGSQVQASKDALEKVLADLDADDAMAWSEAGT